jgi:hypothetical protein
MADQLPPAPCPACADKRRHTAEDWKNHPAAGTGNYDAAGQPKAKEATDAAL